MVGEVAAGAMFHALTRAHQNPDASGNIYCAAGGASPEISLFGRGYVIKAQNICGEQHGGGVGGCYERVQESYV